VVTKAKTSIAGFKLREGMPIGVKVTLRRERMYEFLDRLITVAMPRVRDFRGVSAKSFDGRGNYALGLKEHIVFPEINFDKIEQVWGMDIVICTTAKTDAEARRSSSTSTCPSRPERRRETQWQKSAWSSGRRSASARREVRRQARGAEGDRREPGTADGGALQGAPEAREAAAQLRAVAAAQPLRRDRAPARLLPQASHVAHRAPGLRLEGADPGHGQVELVRRGPCR
jgi:hypothetical protein